MSTFSINATPASARSRLTAAAISLAVGAALAAYPPGHPAWADTAPPPGTPATVSADGLPTWQINGVVWSQVTVGDIVYATGKFTRARPPGSPAGSNEVVRDNLVAYSLSTGNLVTSFSHSLNAQGLVAARSPDGTRVYIGGDFSTVDGVTRNRIAAFDTATGALVSSFAPRVGYQVRGIAATSSTVYFGGNFTSVNGVGRTRLGAVNASNGALTSWAPTADNIVRTMVLSPDGSRVIVGGHFRALNGVTAYGMGSVSTTNGATLRWDANKTIKDSGSDGAITSLRTDGSQIYGSGYAFGSGSQFEGTFAADPTTGAIAWLNDCHGDTYDVYPIGQVLYHVGHAHDCSAIGDFPETNPRTWRHALADTTYPTGTNKGPDSYGWNYNGWLAARILTWHPSLGIGSFTGQSQAAWSVTGDSSYVALGGEFPTVNGVAQQGLVRFAVRALAPNRRGPQSSSALTPTVSSPTTGKVSVTWRATWDQDNTALTYQLLRDGGSTPIYTTAVNSRFWILRSIGFTDTLPSGTSHTYRVRVIDPLGNTITGGTSAAVTVR
jgi:hypothetical protein